jgi:hypothetical protein
MDEDSPLGPAADGRLPRYQPMDLATLRWIQGNRPVNLPANRVANPPMSIARYTIVPTNWYANPGQIDGAYGLRHGARVAVLSAHLAQVAGLDAGETLAVVIAAALHDCQREADVDDPGHGVRAAKWFTDQSAKVLTHFNVDNGEVRSEAIAAAVELHDVDYLDFTAEQLDRYEPARAICDIVKTADALDRYRLPDLRSWPSDADLRLIPPPWLHRYAFDLMVLTEQSHLQGMSSERSIVTALAHETL